MQEVIYGQGKHPMLVLYKEQQLADIAAFCTTGAAKPVILGIDRTFNLSPAFVTPTVFPHPYLVRKGT